MIRTSAPARSVALAVLLSACGAEGPPPEGSAADEAAPAEAPATDAATAARDTIAVAIRDQNGADVGEAMLEGTPGGVLIRARLHGVPAGTHAFHIHETGACEPPFESAGGHLAAEGEKHGFRSPDGPHVGDLPNVYVAEGDTLRFDAFADGVSLTGPAPALLDGDGAALVVHAGADDYASDPAGDAGARIACGAIAP